MGQIEGVIGHLVDRMIRRSVRTRFRKVYWIPPEEVHTPTIFVPNHHGWYDGYLMYHALTALNAPFKDWITEFDAFPLFGKVGGMPFPANDPSRRIATIKKSVRLMKQENLNLLLFAEQHLHRGPQVLPLGGALELIVRKVPNCRVVPVAIRYDMSMHERPEAFLKFGSALPDAEDILRKTRLAILNEMDQLEAKLRIQPEAFQVLVTGTLDVNERWDMRRVLPKK